MTIVKNKAGVFEADIRDRKIARLHVSLGTKRKAEAEILHAALVALVREGDAELVGLIRRRDVNVREVARLVREKRPFSDLRPALQWPTVADAAASYVEWLRAHPEREASTADAAQTQIGHFAREFGDVRLDQIDLKAAAAWQARVLETAATNSARMIVNRVVALYRWHASEEARAAQAERRAPRALAVPLDPKTRPTRMTRRERFLSRAEAATLWEGTPEAFRAPVALGLLAGLRIQEALWLRPADVDLTHDLLVIQERGEKGTADYWRPKSGERREVPIGADLRAILARHLECYASDAYLTPSRRDGTRPLDPGRARELFQRVVLGAGLTYGREDPQGVVYHTLRHTFASWLMVADVNPVRIAKLLGNSLEMVMEVYGHLAPKDNRAAVALLNGVVPLPALPDAPPAASP